jgi:hypothetical protein
MKVDLHFYGKNPYQIQVYWRCRQAFKERGIELRFFPDTFPDVKSNAHVFVVQQMYFQKGLSERLGRPVIVEEKEDTSMPTARDLLSFKNVQCCFKVSVVRPDWMNLPTKRPFLWLLGEKSTKTKIRLNEKDITKIRPGIHFGQFDCMRSWVERARKRQKDDQWRKRPIDALFMGTTRYEKPWIPALTRHRQQFAKNLRKIAGLKIMCAMNRAIPRGDYFRLSNQTKIIVSPWGYGEICYRDFEGILDDCVLIKPRTNFIQTLGDVLEEGQTYQGCQIDASDLEATIRRVLKSDLYSDPELRWRNRERILSWWSEEKIADWWCKQVMS